MIRTVARLGAAALAGAASCAHAQTLGGAAAEAGPSAWRVLAALIACLTLALGAAVFLRARLNGGAPAWPRLASLWPGEPRQGTARRMKLVETVRLSHQIDVCLLRCDDVEFIVTTSAQGAVVVRAPFPAQGELT